MDLEEQTANPQTWSSGWARKVKDFMWLEPTATAVSSAALRPGLPWGVLLGLAPQATPASRSPPPPWADWDTAVCSGTAEHCVDPQHRSHGAVGGGDRARHTGGCASWSSSHVCETTQKAPAGAAALHAQHAGCPPGQSPGRAGPSTSRGPWRTLLSWARAKPLGGRA